MRLLRSGEIDLAIAIGVKEEVGVSAVQLSEEPFYVALPSSDPLCMKRELAVQDLSTRKLALFERQVNPAVVDRLHKTFSEERVYPAEVQYFIQPEEAAALVLQRKSLVLLTKTAAWRLSDEIITIRPLKDDRLLLRTFLAARTDEQSRLVSEFVRATVRRLSLPLRQVPLALAV